MSVSMGFFVGVSVRFITTQFPESKRTVIYQLGLGLGLRFNRLPYREDGKIYFGGVGECNK